MKYRIAIAATCIITMSFITYQKKSAAVRQAQIPNRPTVMRQTALNEMETAAVSPEPWTTKQLMAPSVLAELINNPNAKKPIIICVGPGALIKGSLDMGPANEKENFEKLKLQLSKLSRDADIVIYCGCCPFEHCPNIRPAFALLNEMKFTNTHLLNLEHNIKTDWVAKGYPKA